MNPSYFRIQLPLPEAQRRLASWLGLPELSGLVQTDSMCAVDLACWPGGGRRGAALFMSQVDDWSLFNDLTGGFSSTPASDWLKFAKTNSFVFAGYNDAICCGELVVIENGEILREFSDDRENPDTNLDFGRLPQEALAPIKSWIEVASFVDGDSSAFSDEGLLWVRESA